MARSLVSSGLIEVLHEIMEESLGQGVCQYKDVSEKVNALEEADPQRMICFTHKICPFAPVYRCNSPSFQKVIVI